MEINRNDIKDNGMPKLKRGMLRKALDGAEKIAPAAVLAATLSIAPNAKAQSQQQKAQMAEQRARFEMCLQEQPPIMPYYGYWGYGYGAPYAMNPAAPLTCTFLENLNGSLRNYRRSKEDTSESNAVEKSVDSALTFAVGKGISFNGKGVENGNARFVFGIERATGQIWFAKTKTSYPVIEHVTMDGSVTVDGQKISVHREYLVGQGPDNALLVVRRGSQDDGK